MITCKFYFIQYKIFFKYKKIFYNNIELQQIIFRNMKSHFQTHTMVVIIFTMLLSNTYGCKIGIS